MAQQGDSPLKLIDESVLSHPPLFRTMDPVQLRNILHLAETRYLPNRSTIYHQGRSADRFHVISAGHVRLVRTTVEGEQIIILHLSAGEQFGFGAPIGPQVRQESASAVGACLLLSWPNRLWQVFADTCPGFAGETLRCLNKRTDELSTRVVESSTKSVEQRIACALLRLISQSGKKAQNGIEIDFPVTRQNIADMTGATLHTVSRALSRWERLGLIDGSTRCRIIVMNPHRLVMISAGTDRNPTD